MPNLVASVWGFNNYAGCASIASIHVSPAALRERLLKRVADNLGGLEHINRGVLLQKDGLLITRPDELPWEATPIPGILSKALRVDRKRKYATSLVRVEPMAVYPPHRNSDIEEVLLLEGDFLIDGVGMVPGDYCRSEPGSIHGQSTTVSGALLLVFASQQDEMPRSHEPRNNRPDAA